MAYPFYNHLRELIDFYQRLEGNESGGSLHIVLADCNDDESSIEFCLDLALKNKDYLGAYIASELLKFKSEKKVKAFFDEEYWELDDK